MTQPISVTPVFPEDFPAEVYDAFTFQGVKTVLHYADGFVPLRAGPSTGACAMYHLNAGMYFRSDFVYQRSVPRGKGPAFVAWDASHRRIERFRPGGYLPPRADRTPARARRTTAQEAP